MASLEGWSGPDCCAVGGRRPSRLVRFAHSHLRVTGLEWCSAQQKTPSNVDMETRCRGAVRPGFAKFLLVAPLARGAERRKALVRNAAPVAALRLGQSLQRKGLPVHDADRRALRRSTTVFAKPWPHSLSGRAFLPGLLTCSPGSPAGSLRTGHLVPVGRGPRRPGSPVVSRTRRQTVPASPSGNHPDGAPQQAG